MGKDAPSRARQTKIVTMFPNITGRWRENRGTAAEVVWGTVDASVLRLVIDSVTRAGGAIMFGRTSDGGAYSICVLQDDQRLKEYPHTTEECEELLRAIAEEVLG